MKKSHRKLLASAFLTIVAITLMVTVSYAWFTLADSPALSGVQINIGGSNTIRIAPDLSKVVDGKTVHYPGAFGESLDVASFESYDYLSELAGLTPVSTADGVNWFLPKDDTDLEVKGELDLSAYENDRMLKNANITVSAEKATVEGVSGSYAYVDFWVVSPMDDCSLRISIGSEEEGSYLIALPQVSEDGGTVTGYKLVEAAEIAASARVGFLVNDEPIVENAAMVQYAASEDYESDYKRLKGSYPQKGQYLSDAAAYQFTIYEPNGDLHVGEGLSFVQTEHGIEYIDCENGDYAITSPIGYVNGQAVLADVSDILTVQKTNSWTRAADGDLMLNQIFQSSMIKRDLADMSKEEIAQLFYHDILQNCFTGYTKCAQFIQNTQDLYNLSGGTVKAADQMGALATENATDSAVIADLERNVPQKIRMFIWLEGQDVDCAKEIALQSFALSIELAGSTK